MTNATTASPTESFTCATPAAAPEHGPGHLGAVGEEHQDHRDDRDGADRDPDRERQDFADGPTHRRILPALPQLRAERSTPPSASGASHSRVGGGSGTHLVQN